MTLVLPPIISDIITIDESRDKSECLSITVSRHHVSAWAPDAPDGGKLQPRLGRRLIGLDVHRPRRWNVIPPDIPRDLSIDSP